MFSTLYALPPPISPRNPKCRAVTLELKDELRPFDRHSLPKKHDFRNDRAEKKRVSALLPPIRTRKTDRSFRN
ncbi:hypothetical protein SBA6_410058 [Candidatus Sulfopaludibacter sp. SbA6]|nr:hypothetical protein SBA6_410058 [Candidatus Sulfopaludibacter sp. SbA6]